MADHETLAFHTGLPALDAVLQRVLPGDNIVWQVDSIDDYVPFVHAFCKRAHVERKNLVYFRFADHQNLLEEIPEVNAEIYVLNPDLGFEHFLTKIFSVIESHGLGACYVFDCLTDLAADWYSDVMLANFFMLTCPYLYDLDTATYFSLIRNHNASHALKNIHNTAQVVIDLYRYNGEIYLHPLKVINRHSRTMYMLHRWDRTGPDAGSFKPVTESVITSEILSRIEQPWLDFTVKRLDHWSQTFRTAQELCEPNRCQSIPPDQRTAWKDRLIKMAIARTNDERHKLALTYFELYDLLDIGKRMIGTGLVGGKTAGMLLAQAILRKQAPGLAARLEVHDSFFVGSDVYYTFLVRNKCWWRRKRLSSPQTFGEGIDETREIMLKGTFTNAILQQFVEMLNYFGQSPIIVRSSSLQEDAYGNSFSGKYVSVFLANQGTPEERLAEFTNAVRTIYASTISIDALTYRKTRGLLELDEQMALLVQRVSGNRYGEFYFPHMAGVGFSFNPYCWDTRIDPASGMLRLVFGLGTRAVDRTDDDYTRIVALNAPTLRSEHDFSEINRYSQKKVDLIDLKNNRYGCESFETVATGVADLPIDLFTTRDVEMERRAAEYGSRGVFSNVLTFDALMGNERFIDDFRTILATLQSAYNHPVDVEFTINFRDRDDYRINMLQCRPFQVKREVQGVAEPSQIEPRSLVFKTQGPIIGNSVAAGIDRVIYVVPSVYGKLPEQDRYRIAQVLGEVAHAGDTEQLRVMLMGPGRWGTSTPSLGIPVRFAQISSVSVLGEIAEMHEGLIPDVSLGSHFFNDLVELDILYFGLHPTREGNTLNRDFFAEAPNALARLVPAAQKWEHAIKVIDFPTADGRSLKINMNSLTQAGVAYVEH